MNFRSILSLPDSWRRPASALGALVLAGGAAWSVARLDIGWSEVRLGPLALSFLLAAPLTLAVGAAALQLSGRAVGVRIGFLDALRTVSHANFAEVLPVPGGALVRGAALVKAGAGMGASARIVTLTAIQMLALLTLLSSAALWAMGFGAGLPLTFASGSAVLVGFWLIYRMAGLGNALLILVVRLVTAASGVLAVHLALAAIARDATLTEAAFLTVSGSLGTAVSFVPAGVGISEGIAAALATLTSVPSSAAFLAVALIRAAGLTMSAIFAVFLPR